MGANVTNYRKYGNKVVPKLLEKVDITAIVDDVTTGGTNLPLSAEQGKSLNQKINNAEAARVQAIVDLKDGASSDFNTLGKIETKAKAEEQARIAADTYEAEQRAIAINAAEQRAKTAEDAILATVANNKQLSEANVAGLRTDMENADAALNTLIEQKDTRALTAENALDTKVVTEINLRSTQFTTLGDRISAETENRTNTDAAIGQRIGLLEMAVANGISWKEAVQSIADLDTFVENEKIAGWAYYVKNDKDVYIVIDGVDGDYKPESWVSKSFLKIADFNEISQLVQGEKIRAVAAEAELKRMTEVLTAAVDQYIEALRLDLNTINQRAIDAENTLGQNITKVAQDASAALKGSVKSLTDNDNAILEKMGIDKAEVKQLITIADERATQSEAALSKKIDDTKGAVDLITNDLDARLDVIENDETVAGSIKNVLMLAKKYVDDMTPKMKLQGDDSNTIVQNDTITLDYIPILGKNGVINGEVIVYTLSDDVVPVRVQNIIGSTLYLAVNKSGEYDGGAAVLSFIYRDADQVGAGNALAGQGGAGA